MTASSASSVNITVRDLVTHVQHVHTLSSIHTHTHTPFKRLKLGGGGEGEGHWANKIGRNNNRRFLARSFSRCCLLPFIFINDERSKGKKELIVIIVITYIYIYKMVVRREKKNRGERRERKRENYPFKLLFLSPLNSSQRWESFHRNARDLFELRYIMDRSGSRRQGKRRSLIAEQFFTKLLQ